jgi:hypothetical protein
MPTHSIVMAGLVPAIHVFLNCGDENKTWMPAPSAGMTVERRCRLYNLSMSQGFQPR